MEEFFFIFQKNFSGQPKFSDRGGQKPPEPPHDLQDFAKQRQRQPAQSEKVEPAPQEHRRPVVDAHLPRVPEDGQQEQGDRRPQPEDEIQQGGQPLERNTPADGPHEVVHQPQRRPQQKALAEHRGLGRYVRGHQRSSREKKPPLDGPASSS